MCNNIPKKPADLFDFFCEQTVGRLKTQEKQCNLTLYGEKIKQFFCVFKVFVTIIIIIVFKNVIGQNRFRPYKY